MIMILCAPGLCPLPRLGGGAPVIGGGGGGNTRALSNRRFDCGTPSVGDYAATSPETGEGISICDSPTG
jgi:hypothetical protein